MRQRLLEIVRVFALSVAVSGLAIGQTLPAAVPMLTPEVQYFGTDGKPLAGGKLCTYAAGTNTPLATYTDASAGTPNTNPVVLDVGGRASVWVSPTVLYKFVLRVGGDATCTTGTIQWTQDNVGYYDQSILPALASATRPTTGSSLIGYREPGLNKPATTVQAELDALSAVLPPINSNYVIDIRTYHPAGDGVRSNGSMTALSSTLNDARGIFAITDVGKPIYVKGAGSAGLSGFDLFTTIDSYISATQVTLTDGAIHTVSSAAYGYGTDDGPAIRSAFADLASQGGGIIVFPVPGTFFLASSTGTTIFGEDFNIDLTSSNIQVWMSEGARFLEGCDCGVVSVNYATRNQWTEIAGGLSGCVTDCAVVYGMTPLPAAGARTATLSNPGDAANFHVGDFILIRTGYVLPFNLSPPQDVPDAEINQIEQINYSTGAITLRWHTLKPYVAEDYPSDSSFGGFAGTPTPFGISNVTPIILQNIQFQNLQLISDMDHAALEGGQTFGFFIYGGNAQTVAMFHAFNFTRFERVQNMTISMDPVRSQVASIGTAFTNSYWLSTATGTSDVIFSGNQLDSTGNSYVHVHEGSQLKLLNNTINPYAPSNTAVQTTVSIRARNYETVVSGNVINDTYTWAIYADPTCVAGGTINNNTILNTSVAGGGAIINIAGSGGWTANGNTGTAIVAGLTTVNVLTPNFATAGRVQVQASNNQQLSYPTFFYKSNVNAAISNCTNANPAVCTTTLNIPTGSHVKLSGFTDTWTSLNSTFTATNLSTTTFSVPINSTGFGSPDLTNANAAYFLLGLLGIGNATPGLPLDVIYDTPGSNGFGALVSNINATAGTISGMILRTNNAKASANQSVGILLEHSSSPDYLIINNATGLFSVFDYDKSNDFIGMDANHNFFTGGAVSPGGVAFASLSGITIQPGAVSMVGCTDCDTPAAPGDVCTSAGAKAGAAAIRSRGVWKCF